MYSVLAHLILLNGHRTKLFSIQEDNNIFSEDHRAFLFEN